MINLLDQLDERIKALGADWPKYTVVGSFVLYAVGYLVLRFHLTALGLVTDLTVLDERYLFAGARFFVFLVSAVPVLVLLALPPWLLSLGICRVLPQRWRALIRDRPIPPASLALIGILLAVFMIQFVMRQSFLLHDLLLAERLPRDPAWLRSLFFDDRLGLLYFYALVASCLLTLGSFLSLMAIEAPSTGLRRARDLLAFLTAVQLLFVPINYGVLVVDKSLPRVAAIGNRTLVPGEAGWLVWQVKDRATYLLRSAEDGHRRLITQPGTPPQTIEVLAIEPIIPALFDPSGRARLPPWENQK